MATLNRSDFDKCFDDIDNLLDQWRDEKRQAIACLTALKYYVQSSLDAIESDKGPEVSNQLALEIAKVTTLLKEEDSKPDKMQIAALRQVQFKQYR